MKTLNLTDIDKSDIKYQIQKFPDGQQNIVILDYKEGDNFKWGEPLLASPVTIKSRLNNWLDLELIICAKKCLDNLGFNNINLHTPYFLGARADRKFEEGGNNYLKDVICPIINSLKFDSVTCLDPHSTCLEMGINNFKKIDNLELFKFFVKDKGLKNNWELMTHSILVSPDAGASHKIYKLAEQIGYTGDIITCSKERDKDGKLSKTNVPIFDLSKDVIIIDDIFDYGKTFTNIAREITNRSCKGKLYLIVTHSIQEKGLEEALRWFDCIYTTNSYKEHNLDKVKQLNVF